VVIKANLNAKFLREPMAQPPARDSFQLLDWIMSRHVHEYLDTAGRPVGEGRAAAYQHVQTEMQSCPYAGSRYHHSKPMNVSALRLMIPAWDDILSMLAWLSLRFRVSQQKEVTTYDDLSQVTSSGVFLSDYLVLRKHQPLRTQQIPVLISGLYKVCLGFQLATFLGSVKGRLGGETSPECLPDSAGFHAHLEEQNLLIGEAEVCSGSQAMIMQAYDAMTGRTDVTQEALPVECSNLNIAWEQFDVFTDHAATLWNDLTFYVIRAAQFRPELTDPELPPAVRERLNLLLKQRGNQLQDGQRGLVVDIASAMREYCGNVTEEIPRSAEYPTTSSLTAIILAWLNDVAGDDMQPHAVAIANDLQSQLAPYDLYEETVLAKINDHLNMISRSLGLDIPTASLTSSSISHICGRTLRDWGDPSW